LNARSCWRSAALVGLACFRPAPLAAQRGFDVQGQALSLVGAAAFVGAGAGAGVRLGPGTRVSLAAAGGWLESAGAAGRVEALVTYHLASFGRPRPSFYGGAGVGVTGDESDVAGHLVLVLGVEARPGGGWFLETGVGGGVRVALGYRVTWWRRVRRAP
jgi:hypothetical protein